MVFDADWSLTGDRSLRSEVKRHDKEKEYGYESLWKDAQSDNLPIFDREVIVLCQPYPLEGNEYTVSFAHRPNPDGWDGKNIITGEIEHYTPHIYDRDKGGWSIPSVVWWLDCELPIKKE